jgi:hypothetical protein
LTVVCSGNKGPDFIGVQKAGFGNPWDVRTASKVPLSEDMLASLVDGFKSAGFGVTTIKVDFNESAAAVQERLLAQYCPFPRVLFGKKVLTGRMRT